MRYWILAAMISTSASGCCYFEGTCRPVFRVNVVEARVDGVPIDIQRSSLPEPVVVDFDNNCQVLVKMGQIHRGDLHISIRPMTPGCLVTLEDLEMKSDLLSDFSIFALPTEVTDRSSFLIGYSPWDLDSQSLRVDARFIITAVHGRKERRDLAVTYLLSQGLRATR